jgi:hypothetical protein
MVVTPFTEVFEAIKISAVYWLLYQLESGTENYHPEWILIGLIWSLI